MHQKPKALQSARAQERQCPLEGRGLVLAHPRLKKGLSLEKKAPMRFKVIKAIQILLGFEKARSRVGGNQNQTTQTNRDLKNRKNNAKSDTLWAISYYTVYAVFFLPGISSLFQLTFLGFVSCSPPPPNSILEGCSYYYMMCWPK